MGGEVSETATHTAALSGTSHETHQAGASAVSGITLGCRRRAASRNSPDDATRLVSMHPMETTTATRVTATATMTQHTHPTKAASATDAATGTVFSFFFFFPHGLSLFWSGVLHCGWMTGTSHSDSSSGKYESMCAPASLENGYCCGCCVCCFAAASSSAALRRVLW